MDQLEKRKFSLIRWVKYYTNKCRKLLAEMVGVSFGGVSSAVEIKYTVPPFYQEMITSYNKAKLQSQSNFVENNSIMVI